MNLSLYKRGSSLEGKRPKEALKVYGKLERKNTEFFADILLAGIICPFFASIFAFHVLHYVGFHQPFFGALIVSVLGFSPLFLLYGEKSAQKEEKLTGISTRKHHLIASFYLPVWIIILCLLELVIIVIIGGLVAIVVLIFFSLARHFLPGIPFLWLNELPLNLTQIVFPVCILIVLIVWISETKVMTSPVKMLKGIPIGLKVNSHSVLKFMASTALAVFLVGYGPLDIFYESLYHTVVASCFTGFLLGFTFAGALEKDYVLGTLFRIARIRCLIRLNRDIEAEHRLDLLVDDIKFDVLPDFERGRLNSLAYSLQALMDRTPQSLEYAKGALSKVAESVESNDTYREIYMDSIQKEKELFSTISQELDFT